MITEYQIIEKYVKSLAEFAKNNPNLDKYEFSEGFFEAVRISTQRRRTFLYPPPKDNLISTLVCPKLIRCIASYDEYEKDMPSDLDSILKKLSKKGLIQKIK